MFELSIIYSGPRSEVKPQGRVMILCGHVRSSLFAEGVFTGNVPTPRSLNTVDSSSTDMFPIRFKSSSTSGVTDRLVLKNLLFNRVCTVGRLRASFCKHIRTISLKEREKDSPGACQSFIDRKSSSNSYLYSTFLSSNSSMKAVLLGL
mmetsp:Transcript_35337/g.119653  ORF Transcript_35337/g.119653 Transcript_35337/m.119653 type:complete len:148 (-) Transcript_35337:343-786(-)